jgi:hypothetical protein
MIWLWRLLGLRRLLALVVLRKAWRLYRSRNAANAADATSGPSR